MMTFRNTLMVVGAVAALGCGKTLDASGGTAGNHGDTCVPAQLMARDDATGCAAGLVCEPAGAPQDDAFVCAYLLEVHGRVYDALSGDPLADARVAALDETGAAVSDVAATDADGTYALPISARRDADGRPIEPQVWTLFATARDHQPFPAGIRPAVPIDASEATGPADSSEAAVIRNAATELALLPLPAAEQGGSTLRGVVQAERPAGTLVVAHGEAQAPYAIADTVGRFAVFNVASGDVTLRGYRRDTEIAPVPLTVTGDAEVELRAHTEDRDAMATVAGAVNIVNAPGNAVTSVVLVPVSVYQESLERGPVPFGLRAPAPPLDPALTGPFVIEGVPQGTYKVLAAFENDDLVRDPDASIAGTQIAQIDVPAGGGRVDVGESFKLTEALAVLGPGAELPEGVDDPPTLRFADDSSEDRYELVVYDALGASVWEDLAVPKVSGSNAVEVVYGGPSLRPGMVYQFRATSVRDTPQGAFAISRTEDLRGVFFVR